MKTVIITQARTGSSRLPGKVLKKVQGRPLLEIHLKRLLKTRGVDRVVVATSDKAADQAIVDLASRYVEVFRGPEEDVFQRYLLVVKHLAPQIVIRVTSDCPLIDPLLIEEIHQHFQKNDYHFLSNMLESTYPEGFAVEVFSAAEFLKLEERDLNSYQRQHVTPYFYTPPTCSGYAIANYRHQAPPDYSHLRLTLDQAEDFEVISKVIENIGPQASWKEYAQFLASNPHLMRLNGHYLVKKT